MNFWYNNWLDKSSLIHKVNPNIKELIDKSKISDFITMELNQSK